MARYVLLVTFGPIDSPASRRRSICSGRKASAFVQIGQAVSVRSRV